MSIRIFLFTLFTIFIPASIVAAAESCPSVSSIEKIGDGVFRADGVKGEWSGVLQGNLPSNLFVKHFEKALVIQPDKLEPLQLQYCSYELSFGKPVHLLFYPAGPHPDKSVIVTLVDKDKFWKEEEGVFGMTNYVCRSDSPKNCKVELK